MASDGQLNASEARTVRCRGSAGLITCSRSTTTKRSARRCSRVSRSIQGCAPTIFRPPPLEPARCRSPRPSPFCARQRRSFTRLQARRSDPLSAARQHEHDQRHRAATITPASTNSITSKSQSGTSSLPGGGIRTCRQALRVVDQRSLQTRPRRRRSAWCNRVANASQKAFAFNAGLYAGLPSQTLELA